MVMVVVVSVSQHVNIRLRVVDSLNQEISGSIDMILSIASIDILDRRRAALLPTGMQPLP
jgi:hypothetical protein